MQVIDHVVEERLILDAKTMKNALIEIWSLLEDIYPNMKVFSVEINEEGKKLVAKLKMIRIESI